MRNWLLLFLTASCCFTLLSSTNAASVVVKGKGTESFGPASDEIHFTSQTTFNDAGLRTSETRFYTDEENTLFRKSITTFNFRGQEVLRTYYSQIVENEWEENGLKAIFRYTKNGQLAEETLSLDDVIIKSNLYSYDEYYYEKYSLDYLTGLFVWDINQGGYRAVFFVDADHETADLDDQGRVVTKYFSLFLADGSCVSMKSKSEFEYNDDNGEVSREVEYSFDFENSVFLPDCSCVYSYYPGSKNVRSETFYSFYDDTFHPVEKIEYEYNENNSLTYEAYYSFDNNDFHFSYSRRYEYDSNGNLVKKEYYDADSSEQPVYVGWDLFEYNEKGLQTSRVGYDKDEVEGFYKYDEGYATYDELDRVLTVYYEILLDGAWEKEEHTYNENLEIIDFSSHIEKRREVYGRDEDGELNLYEEYSYSDDEPMLEKRETAVYNASGKVIGIALAFQEGNITNIIERGENDKVLRRSFSFSDEENSFDVWSEEMSYDSNDKLLSRTYNGFFGEEFNKSYLTDCVEYETTFTSLVDPNAGIIVRGDIGRIEVVGADGKQMRVVSANGVVLYNDAAVTIAMRPGLYVVEIDGVASKVIVR